MRGTFGNIRIKNKLVSREGGFTVKNGDIMPFYTAAMKYQEENTPLVILAGKMYGAGSSRDWAAKGTKLLGVKVIIAESFERIHRSNLIGMGILPLQFIDGMNRLNLKLTGGELINIIDLEKGVKPLDKIKVEIKYDSGDIKTIETVCRIDTKNEIEYFKNDGILKYVLRKMI